MTDARKDHLLGAQVGDYVIEERIGIGGMGVVYRASQRRIGKTVAIKVLRAEVMEDPREMERFLDEARSVNEIQHRGIIQIFGSGELPDGRQYLVMEYLKGEALDAKLKREGRIPSADLLPILEEITSALQGVHNAGIVHRDLKPGNVFLVDQSDGRPWVKLLDFGLARRGERTDVSRIAGTPDYLSPEHSRGLPASPASDLYSLGVMTFQLLTGQLPFNGRSALEVMEKHVYSEPPNPVALEPSIPDALHQLIAALLRKEPNARPQIQQVKALLKEAAKQVRAASTQPGEVSASEVLAARARAATDPSEPAQQPVTQQSGAVTPAAMPLFESLPPAIAGRRPPDSGDLGTPSSGAARTGEATGSWRQGRWLLLAFGAVGLVVLGVFAVVSLQAEGPEKRSRPLLQPQRDVAARPLDLPRRDLADTPGRAEPIDEEPMFNPHAAQQPDGGG